MRKISLFWIMLAVILLAGVMMVIFSQLKLNEERKSENMQKPAANEMHVLPKLPDDAAPGMPVKIDTSDLQSPPPLDIEALKAPQGQLHPELLTPPQTLPTPPLPSVTPEIPLPPQLPPAGR